MRTEETILLPRPLVRALKDLVDPKSVITPEVIFIPSESWVIVAEDRFAVRFVVPQVREMPGPVFRTTKKALESALVNRASMVAVEVFSANYDSYKQVMDIIRWSMETTLDPASSVKLRTRLLAKLFGALAPVVEELKFHVGPTDRSPVVLDSPGCRVCVMPCL